MWPDVPAKQGEKLFFFHWQSIRSGHGTPGRVQDTRERRQMQIKKAPETEQPPHAVHLVSHRMHTGPDGTEPQRRSGQEDVLPCRRAVLHPVALVLLRVQVAADQKSDRRLREHGCVGMDCRDRVEQCAVMIAMKCQGCSFPADGAATQRSAVR